MPRIAETDTRFSTLVAFMMRGVVFAAAACLLSLTAIWLLSRPTQTVLAEVEPTWTPSPTPISVSASPELTPTLKSTPVVNEPVMDPTSSPTAVPPVHLVGPGETLIMLAGRYGVSVDALVAVNDLGNPDLLYVGQRIVLPDEVSGVVTVPEPTPEVTPTAVSDPAAPISSLASPDEIIEGRWIDVDLSEQRLTAYEASTAVRTTLVSTGLPGTPTPVGQFRIWIKFRYDDMAGDDYYIEDVPYVMYFHEGYGLHGVTWHGNFGHPMSHGCVNLPSSETEWLFNWAEIGTLVNVHE